jgi:hypothetical protein
MNHRGADAEALDAYADAAHIPAARALDFLPAYLERSVRSLNPRRRSGRAGLRARRELLRAIGGYDR